MFWSGVRRGAWTIVFQGPTKDFEPLLCFTQVTCEQCSALLCRHLFLCDLSLSRVPQQAVLQHANDVGSAVCLVPAHCSVV